MADPVSITGLALQIGLALKQLYDFAKQVKGAQADIKQICLELSALRSLLEDFKAQHTAERPPTALHESLQGAQSTVGELLEALEPSRSSIGRFKQSLTWPLKYGDVARILSGLERAKTLLMLCLMGETQTFKQDLSGIKEGVSTILANQETQQQAESRQRLLASIAPVSPKMAHSSACAVWKGTKSGRWLIDEKLPLLDTHPLMALEGISGSGKTILFSRAVEHLSEKAAKPSVAYMYCAYNDASTQMAENILGAWIAQLWPLQPAALHGLSDALSAGETVPISMLSAVLVEIAEAAGGITLALDAVNECKNSSDIVSVVLDLAGRSANIRALISSTPSDQLIERMRNYASCFLIALSATSMNPDIEQYIRMEIAKHPVLQRMPEHEIIDPVLQRADGMFRWASCQMSLLAEQATPRKVRQTLGQLPRTLNETYVALLQRVSESSRDVVRKVLLWLSLTQIPLDLKELIDAIAFEPEEGFIDDDCRIDPPMRLVEMCQGLVVWNTDTETVSLAHSSIRSFLMSDFICTSQMAYYALEETAGHASLALTCLSYLLMDQFNVGSCDWEIFHQLHENYPLLDYAIHFWAVHAAAQKSLTPEQTSLIDRLFWSHRSEIHGGHFTFWVRCLIPDAEDAIVRSAEPLYYAASFGLTEIVASMLQNGSVSLSNTDDPWFIDRHCGRAESTALQVACWRGHREVVSLLLQAGADPNTGSIVGATCLYCARWRGHSEIGQMLMDKGARVAYWTDSMRALALSALRRAIIEVLDIRPSLLTESTNLYDLGLDSLLVMNISHRVEKETGSRIPMIFVLSNPTLHAIKEEFFSETDWAVEEAEEWIEMRRRTEEEEIGRGKMGREYRYIPLRPATK